MLDAVIVVSSPGSVRGDGTLQGSEPLCDQEGEDRAGAVTGEVSGWIRRAGNRQGQRYTSGCPDTTELLPGRIIDSKHGCASANHSRSCDLKLEMKGEYTLKGVIDHRSSSGIVLAS